MSERPDIQDRLYEEFSLSVMLGYLFEYAGLVAAMSAYAVYDLVMLWWAIRVE